MIIGVPKEIKNNENRVGLTPAGAYVLTSHGHTVLVEQGAGAGSSFTDQDYVAAGGIILEEKRELFDRAEMITDLESARNHIAISKDNRVVQNLINSYLLNPRGVEVINFQNLDTGTP